MSHYLLNQLDFIRKVSLKGIEGISEEKALVIPNGFQNNILWQLGHIFVVHEKLVLAPLEIPMEQFEKMSEYFGPGTSPASWENEPPNLKEVIQLLEQQPKRLEQLLQGKLTEIVRHPFTTKSGLRLETSEQLVSFALYHEGVHISTIKAYDKLT